MYQCSEYGSGSVGFVCFWASGILIRQRYGSKDPDPYTKMSRIPNTLYNFSVCSTLAFLFLLYSLFKERSEEVDLQEVLKEIDEQIKERFSLFIFFYKFEVLSAWYLIGILCSYLNPLLLHIKFTIAKLF
jgi:hypothetical protein